MTKVRKWCPLAFPIERCSAQAEPPLWSRDNIVTSQAARPVRSPVGSTSCLRFFRSFPSTASQSQEIWATFFPGYHMAIIYHPNPYIIRLRMAMVSDHSCSTQPSLNNKQQQPYRQKLTVFKYIVSAYMHHHHVFCPRAGPSLQTQAPRLQFCPKADLPLQTQEPKLQFDQG